MEKVKKSGLSLGGFQHGLGHSSLMVPGPAPKPDLTQVTQFFSPQNMKGRSIITHDFDDKAETAKKTRNILSTLQPAGGQAHGARNNSMYVGSADAKMLSPITHRPVGNLGASGTNFNGSNKKGSATARASTLNHRKTAFEDSQINFTKTSIQARAEGQVKPKAYNAWDILALNDLIKDRIENQNRKMREHKQRIEMRQFYDN